MEAAFLLWASCTFRSFSLAGAASLSQPIVLVVRVLTLYFLLTFALWSPLRTSFIYVVLNIMPISMCNLSLNLFWLWFPISYYKLHIHLGHLTSSLNSTGLKSISCLLAVRLLLSVKGRQIEGVWHRVIHLESSFSFLPSLNQSSDLFKPSFEISLIFVSSLPLLTL